MPQPNYFIGLMSGTSLDAIDAVLVDFDADVDVDVDVDTTNANQPRLPRASRSPQVLASHAEPLPPDYQDAVNQLIHQPTWSLYGHVHHQYAELSIRAVQHILQTAGVPFAQVAAIGSHGQTIWHAPDDKHPLTLQLGDANRIAAATKIPVVADCRGKDIALGGQGAPLVPAFHAAMLAAPDETRIVCNIGGIANITILQPQQPVIGFDTGPGNGLMNLWVKQHRNQAWDHNGEFAASGNVNEVLLADMLADEYFQLAPPKSTGREYFNAAWLTSFNLSDYAAEDVQATLCALTAASIADACADYQPKQVLLCGGGVHNANLLQALIQRTNNNCRVTTTDHFGLAPDWLEAIAFAWLAKQRLQLAHGNISSVTGATHDTVLGALYHP